MNDTHLRYLASPEWAATLRDELLPWVLGSSDLGDDCLEVGSGPGATLLGSDSIEAPAVRAGHDNDIFVPVDPERLGDRLVAAGFEQPEVETKATRVRFAARKP